MKYDDAAWHSEGDFPEGLAPEAGATHIGMFLAWMLLQGFASEALRADAQDDVAALQARAVTGAQFLLKVLDGKLIDEDFTQEGNAFALAYYEGQDNDSRYVDDYFACFGVDADSLYEVPDTWANYEKLSERISQRFATWKAQGRPAFIA